MFGRFCTMHFIAINMMVWMTVLVETSLHEVRVQGNISFIEDGEDQSNANYFGIKGSIANVTDNCEGEIDFPCPRH